jgi:hypothetical protein
VVTGFTLRETLVGNYSERFWAAKIVDLIDFQTASLTTSSFDRDKYIRIHADLACQGCQLAASLCIDSHNALQTSVAAGIDRHISTHHYKHIRNPVDLAMCLNSRNVSSTAFIRHCPGGYSQANVWRTQRSRSYLPESLRKIPSGSEACHEDGRLVQNKGNHSQGP